MILTHALVLPSSFSPFQDFILSTKINLLRSRRGGGGVARWVGTLASPSSPPARDSTHRFAPPPGDASGPTPPPLLSPPHQYQTRNPLRLPHLISPSVKP